MKILLTGEARYIRKRLILELIYNCYKIICTSRDKNKHSAPKSLLGKIKVIKDDFLNFKFPKKISNANFSDFIYVPILDCFRDKRTHRISNKQECIDRIWCIGGQVGWYYTNVLWELRGFMDKLVGGVGLRRGRTQKGMLCAGDTIDFWRVLYANKEEGRLLLFAEMKLPGEAWLEFKVRSNNLEQTTTFRPKGIWGRIYWYAVFPLHDFIFTGMLNNLAK